MHAEQPPAGPTATATGGLSFERYRDGLIHDWMRILAVLAAVLVPLFLLLDTLMMPRELMSRFGLYRGAATVAAVAQYLVLRGTRPGPGSQLHGYVLNLYLSLMIVQMTVELGGIASGYFVGLMLVIFAVNVLLPWRPIHSACNGLLTITLYLLLNVGSGGPFTFAQLANNLYFLISSVVIATAISDARYRLIEREFNLRKALVDSNASLESSRSELKAARDRLWGEMEIAQRIQTALLPADRRLGAYRIRARMVPAEEVGGDYYDFLETRFGEHWAAIGDVSGHGVESGLVMMMTRTAIASLVEDVPRRGPDDVFVRTNGIIRENISRLGSHRFMTLNVIRLLPDRLVIAGKHQDLLIWRAALRAVETVANQGTWIGAFDDVAKATVAEELPLQPGDAVLLFTDGLTEAMDARGEMFGQQRLAELFAQVQRADPPGGDPLAAILSAVQAFQARQEDDLTLMLLQRDP